MCVFISLVASSWDEEFICAEREMKNAIEFFHRFGIFNFAKRNFYISFSFDMGTFLVPKSSSSGVDKGKSLHDYANNQIYAFVPRIKTDFCDECSLALTSSRSNVNSNTKFAHDLHKKSI